MSFPSAFLASVLVLLLASTLRAQVPPDAEWRTFETAHFRVNFIAGLDSLAFRAADRAEWAHGLLAREFMSPPRGKIDLILTDHVDLANGSATPLPTNRITLHAHPSADTDELAFTTDWLEMLILHEMVHIYHLDHAGGVWGALRRVMGRNGWFFPGHDVPGWFVEGLATYYESTLTAGGRVRGTLYEMMLRTAILEDAFFTVDRAGGAPRTWPAARTRYVYGSMFIDFIARTYGEAGLAAFVEAYGRQLVPFRLEHAAQAAFGTGFSSAWSAWEDSLRATYATRPPAPRRSGEPEILTGAGRDAFYPRFSPDSKLIAYSASTGHGPPALHLISAPGVERPIAEQTTAGPVAWSADGAAIVYGDLEYVDPYRLLSDLYRVALEGGAKRLTRASRVAQPDLHPDGRTLVAIRHGGGSSMLVVGDPAEGELRPLVPRSLDIQWATPRWSPSGDRIAAIRWLPGGLHDLVILDSAGRLIEEITHDRAIEGVPGWSPDGRYLVFWSDRTGTPELHAYDLETHRLFQVTQVQTGAIHPDVSPDGRWIAFSHYRADGWRIARIPFDPSTWMEAGPVRDEALPVSVTVPRRAATTAVREYSAWRSLAPSGWALRGAAGGGLGPGVGVGLSGADIVERHAWEADGLVYLDRSRFDGRAGYRYQGWGRPVVELTLAQDWRVVCGAGSLVCGGDGPLPTDILRRDRGASVSLLFARQRMRSYGWLRQGLAMERRDYRWGDEGAVGDLELRQLPVDLSARIELGRSTARAFALSVGPRTGYSIVSALEGHRYARTLDDDPDRRAYLRWLGRGRGYHGAGIGPDDAVLAMRADVGMEFGSRSPGFELGGASGGALPVAFETDVLGRGIAFPVRGYSEGAQVGDRAFTAGVEYRIPLARVERGIGVLPIYFDRVTGDLFGDVGAAWCPGPCTIPLASIASSPDPIASVGAEVVAEFRVGYNTSVPLRLGVAQPLERGRRPRFHLRVDRSF